jgi:ubiquinone/menaquinone biosynthesis C-methylase UbiE
MRNTDDSADYDSRAFDSLVLPQRYWQRKRFQILKEMSGSSARRIDIGCGSGRFIQSEPDTVGLDLEPSKLRFLRRTNPRLVRSNCTALPFADETFETVVNSQLIERLPDGAEVFQEMNRVLEPGGTLVVATPDYGRLAWRFTEAVYKLMFPYASGVKHLTHYTRYRLTEELVQAGFAIDRYRYIMGGEMILRCTKRETWSPNREVEGP